MSKQCPTCSNRKESFFADGTICPTCGRRASLFLDDIGYSSGVRFDEIESLKTALRIKTEEHDCCAEDNITLRKQLAACKELLEETECDKLENYRRLTESRRSHAASQHYAQQLREALEEAASVVNAYYMHPTPLSIRISKTLALPHDTSALDALVKELNELKSARPVCIGCCKAIDEARK